MNKSKPRLSVLPWDALPEVSASVEIGNNKHGRDDWRTRDSQLFFEAALRHLAAASLGEERDPEDGDRHVAKATANLLFYLALTCNT